MGDPWSEFQEATPNTAANTAADPWAEFQEVQPSKPGRPRGAAPRMAGEVVVPAERLVPTGQVHDGDTFRLTNGQNARLYGADAFELAQTAQGRHGELIRLGQQARDAFAPFAQPAAMIGATGGNT